MNTALAGERYSSEAFQHYADKSADAETKVLLQEIIANKKQHIQMLEERLNALGEKPSIPAQAADTYAKLKTALQGSDEIAMLRRALGDMQTAVVDTYQLRNQLTDPVTTEIFSEIEVDQSIYEQHLAQLYRARLGAEIAKPAKPSTAPAVGV